MGCTNWFTALSILTVIPQPMNFLVIASLLRNFFHAWILCFPSLIIFERFRDGEKENS
jgi:hypothetical protein